MNLLKKAAFLKGLFAFGLSKWKGVPLTEIQDPQQHSIAVDMKASRVPSLASASQILRETLRPAGAGGPGALRHAPEEGGGGGSRTKAIPPARNFELPAVLVAGKR